jgi:hypothetical protein
VPGITRSPDHTVPYGRAVDQTTGWKPILHCLDGLRRRFPRHFRARLRSVLSLRDQNATECFAPSRFAGTEGTRS